MPLAIGSPAPDFTLPLGLGIPPITLSDYRGKQSVVVAFFPLAFSGVCTKEICGIQAKLSSLTELNAAVLGVSIDSFWVNQRFAAETGATFPLLSDFNREVVTAWGVRNDDFFGMKGVADRALFIVDPEGTIAYAWHTPDADLLPDLDAVRDVLRTIRGGE